VRSWAFVHLRAQRSRQTAAFGRSYAPWRADFRLGEVPHTGRFRLIIGP